MDSLCYLRLRLIACRWQVAAVPVCPLPGPHSLFYICRTTPPYTRTHLYVHSINPICCLSLSLSSSPSLPPFLSPFCSLSLFQPHYLTLSLSLSLPLLCLPISLSLVDLCPISSPSPPPSLLSQLWVFFTAPGRLKMSHFNSTLMERTLCLSLL